MSTDSTSSPPSPPPTPEEQEKIKNEASWVNLLKQEISRVIVGQKYLIDRLVIGLLANGHVLLEGVVKGPGTELFSEIRLWPFLKRERQGL